MRKLLKTAFMGIWIVPDSQVHILSLPYQEHIFRLFHESLPNRISHYIGIPIACATLYAALPPPLALAVAAIITAVHLAIAVRHRLWLLCGVVLAAQGALGFFAVNVLRPFYAVHSSPWASPWLHMFAWSFLQYCPHVFESKVPEPWARRNMTSRDEWLREAKVQHLLLAVLAIGPHVFVEWFSGPRNLFLLLLRLARWCGYGPRLLTKMDNELNRLQARGEPVLRHAHFHEELARAERLGVESSLQ